MTEFDNTFTNTAPIDAVEVQPLATGTKAESNFIPLNANSPDPHPIIGESDVVKIVAQRIIAEMQKAIVGQEQAVYLMVAGLFAGGHVLLEGVPGTAKTLAVRTLALATSSEFKRIQFTPDLMPSDITGTLVYEQKSGDFVFKHGPIFAGMLLADEINRTPPKTQAALLEAMQERRVTVDGISYPLSPTFTVCATQNPVDFDGTYPLPEAQTDRFIMKIVIDYPPFEVEKSVLQKHHAGFNPNDLTHAGVECVVTESEVERCQAQVGLIGVENDIFEYIVRIVTSTRSHRQVALGAGPRASIALLQVSKAVAAMRGRTFIIPDDIKDVAPSVLRHRIILRPEAEIEGVTADRVVAGVLETTNVPR